MSDFTLNLHCRVHIPFQLYFQICDQQILYLLEYPAVILKLVSYINPKELEEHMVNSCWNNWLALLTASEAILEILRREMFLTMLQQYLCEVALLEPDTARSLPSCPTSMNLLQQETADRDNNKTRSNNENCSNCFFPIQTLFSQQITSRKVKEGWREFDDSQWQAKLTLLIH